jgi:small nuclear ribonucleoprotein (snRNP)-like protein
MAAELDAWKKVTGEKVVIDTNSPYIYLGKLTACNDWFITLENVDVHDQKEGSATKEQYINESAKTGIKINRKRVMIRKDQIISFSKLDDIIVY